MAYRSNFEDIIYPDETGAPCVLRYRFAFAASTRLFVVLHLVHNDPAFVSPNTSAIVRDHLLNRILAERLQGVPVNAIRLAVTDAAGSFEYPIEVDVDDYIRRGNPFDSGQVSSTGTRVIERISLKSENVVAGRARVHTVHASPKELSPAVATAIA
jgi:hypothetical protein